MPCFTAYKRIFERASIQFMHVAEEFIAQHFNRSGKKFDTSFNSVLIGWHYFFTHLCIQIELIIYHLKFIIMAGTKVLLGVLAGAAAGAILGVLFAPDKGVETRRRVSEGGRDVASNLKDKFSDLVDGIADRYESAREGATDLLEKGRQKVSGMTGNSTTGNTATSGATGGASASNMGAGSSYQS